MLVRPTQPALFDKGPRFNILLILEHLCPWYTAIQRYFRSDTDHEERSAPQELAVQEADPAGVLRQWGRRIIARHTEVEAGQRIVLDPRGSDRVAVEGVEVDVMRGGKRNHALQILLRVMSFAQGSLTSHSCTQARRIASLRGSCIVRMYRSRFVSQTVAVPSCEISSVRLVRRGTYIARGYNHTPCLAGRQARHPADCSSKCCLSMQGHFTLPGANSFDGQPPSGEYAQSRGCDKEARLSEDGVSDADALDNVDQLPF